MQTPQTPQTPRNREADDFVGNESFPELADFPTVEELLAALDASLEQSHWLPRPMPIAVDATSRALTQRWRELIGDVSPDMFQESGDDHYLSSWREGEVLRDDLLIEPDFLADFAKFLMRRVAERMSEMRYAQHLLVSELAKLQE